MSEKKPFDPTGIVSTKVPARMLWPALKDPKPFKDPKTGVEGKPKFQATFVLDPAAHGDDIAALKKAAVAVARNKWPGCDLKAATNAAPLTGVFWPFKNGADSQSKNETVKGFLNGKLQLSTSSVKQPLLGLMTEKGIHTLVSVAEVEKHVTGAFYSGVEVIFEVNFKAWDGSKGEKYVTAYVNAVISYQKGDRIGGGKPLEQRFSGYVGQKTTEDPTAGSLDDEIPF